MTTPVMVITGLFFLIGIMVGLIGVVAMANVRSERPGGPDNPPDNAPGWGDEQPPGPGGRGAEHDDRRRWPGDAGSGYHFG
jgi:hypothetical protein